MTGLRIFRQEPAALMVPQARIETVVRNEALMPALFHDTALIDHDQTVHCRYRRQAVGYRDPVAREPLKTDAVFSIASMTKAMTSTAIMSLVEEGRILLGDPVSKFLPPLAELKVADPAGLRAPKQPPTIQDLLRHTSGLTYRERGTTPAHALYPGSSIWASSSGLRLGAQLGEARAEPRIRPLLRTS